MNAQFVLGLSLKEALEKEDFFISSSNLDAVTQLGNTDGWPSGALVLVGPKGSGKTHLSTVWTQEQTAKNLKLEAILPEMEKGLDHDFVGVEDIDSIGKVEKKKKFNIFKKKFPWTKVSKL